jgi:hypothetical protein
LTPYYLGPLDDETIPLVKSLLKLHDFRLLTDGSQPYQHQYGRRGENWFEYEQRPTVSFVMSGEDGHGLEFFERLKKRPEVVVQSSQIYPFVVLPGSHESVPVSRGRIAETKEALKSEEWENVTWALCQPDLSEYYPFDAMKRSKPVWFDVAASKWGVSLDVLGVIEEVAVECNLPRISY